MRTQIAKTAHLTAEYIPHTFLTRTPSPYSAGSSWGLLSRKIFFDFYFSDFSPYSQNVWIENIFFIFSFLLFDFYSYFIFLFFQIIVLFLEYRILLNSIFKILVSTRINFRSIFFICFILYSSRLDCSIPDIKLRLVFTRIKLCRFYALTLKLFISSACYKQTSMFM